MTAIRVAIPDMISPSYFPAIAAVFFGASQLKGRGNVWGTMIALYSLAFGIHGLQLTYANMKWIEPAFQGVSLLGAVALASRQGIVKVKKKKAGEAPAPLASSSAG